MAIQGRNSQAMVTIKNASVRISRTRQLKVGNFQILPGQHWCVFGGNGAGKTLLARMISGDLLPGLRYVSYGPEFEPASDLINVSFEEQQKLWERDNRHDVSEYMADALDVGTTVDALLTQRAVGSRKETESDLQILRELGIEQIRDSGVRFLSSGQVRKVLLARALLSKQAGRARLLILDEPLEAIDKQSQPQVADLINLWMDQDNSTLALCRSEQNILSGITHMAVMKDLQILRQGPVDEVRNSEEFRQLTQLKMNRRIRIPRSGPLPEKNNSAAPPIQLRGVTALYRDKLVLNNISWKMDRCHNTLIEGPNGCGKSTLLSLIDGENHKAYGQEVYLFGLKRGSGESVWDIKSHFGVVSNEIHTKYIRGRKVLDVVVSGFFDSIGLYDDSGGSQIEIARQWLAQLGIAELTKDSYEEISFGQQKLVLLARAMVKQPDILILDEPCVGLDDHFRSFILRAVDAITQSTSTQIVFVSHTEGEQPDCINQHIRFVPAGTGGYTLVIT
ncbi:MAG: ATP-binding cassette domain-containing protein [Gammaproteobacteria bacterium]|nr:ATP-binding cassette domain-containing protein [Gammaproteobacteria bacterium]